MEPAIGNFGVDSYHVNVDTGDCAIHLLVCNAENDTTQKILAAVLIDGGISGDADEITKTIQWIESRYPHEGANSGGNLKFAAVVITHWDADHYAGVLNFFFMTIRQQKQGFQHRNLFWDVNGNPATYLYAPYWKPFRHDEMAKQSANGHTYILFAGPQQHNGDEWVVRMSNNKTVLDQLISLFLLRTAIGKYGSPPARNLIGVNLFTNTVISEEDYPAVNSLATLRTHNPPGYRDYEGALHLNHNAPGLYCIAGNRSILGHGQQEWLADPEGTPFQHRTAPTIKNQSSIVAVVLWKPDTLLGQPRVSHYLAGDADSKFEEYLQQTILNNVTIKTIKLSHHGSRGSSPLSVVSAYSPTNIIVSNPRSRYGHPAWQHVWLFDVWSRAVEQVPGRQLYATKYPYYLLRSAFNTNLFLNGQLSAGPFTVAHLQDKSYKKDSFVASYNNLSIRTSNKFLDDTLEICFDGLYDDADVLHKLTMETEKRWNRFCWPKAHQGSAFVIPIGTNTSIRSGADEMDFLLAFSRENPKYDGRMGYKLKGNPNLQLCHVDEEETLSIQEISKETWEQNTGNWDYVPDHNQDFRLNFGSGDEGGSFMMFAAAGAPTLAKDMTTTGSGLMRLPTRGASISPSNMIAHKGSDVDEMSFVPDTDAKPDDKPPAPRPEKAPKFQVPSTGYALLSTRAFDFFKPSGDSAHFGSMGPVMAIPGLKDLDLLVGSLKTGLLLLQSAPVKGGDVTTVDFAKGDDLSIWFKSALRAESFTAMVDPKRGIITAFNTTLPIGNIRLNFSSNVLILKTTFNEKTPAPPGTTIPQDACAFDEPGLMEGATILCLGLEAFSNQTSLKDVLEYMNLTQLSQTVLMQFLGAIQLQPYMEDGHRNAIWFDPVCDYDTDIRLQLELAGGSDSMLKTLLGYLDPQNLRLDNTYVIAQKNITYKTTKDGTRLIHRGSLIFVTDITLVGTLFQGSIDVSESLGTITLTLSVLEETSVLGTIITWIKTLLQQSSTQNNSQDFDGSFKKWLDQKVGSKSSFQGLQPRSISLNLGYKTNAQGQAQVSSIQSIRIAIEVNLNYGNDQNPVIFLATYTWQNRPKSSLHAISANLWTSAKSLRKSQLLPEWEKFYDLQPVTIKKALPETLDLAALCGISDFPEGLPSEVSRASFLVSSDEVAFSGQMVAKARKNTDGSITRTGAIPSVSLSDVEVSARYVFAQEQGSAEWSVQLGFGVLISPKASDMAIMPAEIRGSIAYQKSGGNSMWKLRGSIQDLSGALLASFFDNDSSSAVVDVIGQISIRSLDVEYDYQGTEASSFVMEGTLMLGPVNLALTFSSNKKQSSSTTKVSEWTFSANVPVPINEQQQAITSGEAGGDDRVKLGSLLKGLLGEDVDQYLPSFVSNIEFERPHSKDQIVMAIKKDVPQKDSDNVQLKPITRLVFYLTLDIAGFSFSLLQCKEVPSAISGPPTTSKTASSTKRIIIASLNDIPTVEIPLIGDIEKPIDQVLYLWIQDTSETAEKEDPSKPDTATKSKGITYGELLAINRTLQASDTTGGAGRSLLYRKTKEKYDDQDIVLESGHHFMLTGKNTKGEAVVILDYVFGKASSAKKPSPSTSSISGGDKKPSTTSTAEKTPTPSDGQVMAPYKKSAGPLSISNVGFGWEGSPKDGGVLSISLDASVLIGPIGFSLIGFKLSFPITTNISLRNLPAPDVSLDGLAASFQKPPLTIAGAFLHQVVDDKHRYMGAVLVSYGVYLFQAAGFYGEVAGVKGKDFESPDLKDKNYKSAFIFCRVNGPLASVGWAELSGLVAGVGYNSSIKFPSAMEVPSFPLISPPQTTSVLDTLTNLMNPGGVIEPRMDSFWIAAGVKVTAFQVLKIEAVLVLSFDPSIKIGIFGLAVADLPPSPGSEPGKFLHVELGLSATIDVALGVMKVEGQLTPASYILDKNCHLTGGFAMYSWFDSPDPTLKGDWVFTIGGYHRSFSPPAHYPVPPRLGISWSFSNNISITGEAYFAITPKICMGGGRLDVTLRAGPLRAWFNAYADFLINYQPFHFTAEGGVNVGIECVLDFCIASITISASLGATLYLEGPPLSGRVTVDFWVTTFNVDFGERPEPPQPVSLSQFFDLVMADGGTGGKMLDSQGHDASPHVFSCQEGLIPKGQGETHEDSPWVVRGAGFAFNVACKFAIASCVVISAANKDEVANNKNSVEKDYDDEKIYARPMRISDPMKSKLEIKIYRDDVVPLALMANEATTTADDQEGWTKVQRIFRPMPTALWGSYDKNSDPSIKGTDPHAMLSTGDAVKYLMTGMDLHAPDAKLSKEEAIEFNAADAMGKDVFEPDAKPTFVQTKDADGAWVPTKPNDDWEKDREVITHEWTSLAATAASVLNAWTKAESFKLWDLKEFEATVPEETIKKFDEMFMTIPAVTSV